MTLKSRKGHRSMRIASRAAVLSLAGAALLLPAGEAAASFTPGIAVTSGAAGATTISYSQSRFDDPVATIVLYAPAAYQAQLGAAPGTTLGTATSTVSAADFGGSSLPLTGAVTAADARDTVSIGGRHVSLVQAGADCTGVAPSDAYWLVSLAAPGLKLQLPVFVDDVTDGPFAGGLRLSVCAPPPGLPTAAVGRAPLGAKLVDLSITLSKVLTVPSGWYTWHLQAAPFAAGGAGQADAAAAVEAQGQDGTRQELTLTATPTKQPRVVRLSGRLTQAGRPVAGQKVRILVGGRQVGHASTNSSGAFSLNRRLTAPVTYTAAATVRPRDAACTAAAFAPARCVGATIGGFVASSKAVRAKP
jgi:hypothetical protein